VIATLRPNGALGHREASQELFGRRSLFYVSEPIIRSLRVRK